MAKRKKKIYNTPKKLKHKNKNISILHFIKSFSNQRCSKCYSIIATHHNRVYCGKCHTN